jgi:hypothetical protein
VGSSVTARAPRRLRPIAICASARQVSVSGARASVAKPGPLLPPVSMAAWDSIKNAPGGGGGPAPGRQLCAVVTLDHGIMVYQVQPEVYFYAAVALTGPVEVCGVVCVCKCGCMGSDPHPGGGLR